MSDSSDSCRIMVLYNLMNDIGIAMGRVFFKCPGMIPEEIIDNVAQLSMADVLDYEERCREDYRSKNPDRVLLSLYITDWRFLVPDREAGG